MFVWLKCVLVYPQMLDECMEYLPGSCIWHKFDPNDEASWDLFYISTHSTKNTDFQPLGTRRSESELGCAAGAGAGIFPMEKYKSSFWPICIIRRSTKRLCLVIQFVTFLGW